MIFFKEINSASKGDEWQDDNTHGGALAVEHVKPKLQRPRLYKVIMLNDDYTPMDFVVHILETFFYMGREQATQIMIKVHTEGSAVCGVYSRDVAETKAEQVNQCSHQSEHPLLCNIEASDYDQSDDHS